MRFVVPFAVLLSGPSLALAHKMIVTPTVTDSVRVVVGYEDESPAEDAKVTLKDAAGAVVSEGITDAKGVCVLPRPKPGTYTLVANDGGGHRRQLQLIIPDDTSTVVPPESRTPFNSRWFRSVVGVAIIGAVTGFVWWVRRRR